MKKLNNPNMMKVCFCVDETTRSANKKVNKLRYSEFSQSEQKQLIFNVYIILNVWHDSQ